MKRFAGRMLTESDRLTRLVQQIIELSRLQGDDPLDAPVAGPGRRRRRARPSTPARSTPTPRGIAIVTGGHARARGASATASRSPPRSPTWSPTPSPTPAPDSTVLVSTKAARATPSRSRSSTRASASPSERDRPDLRALLPRRPGAPPLHRRHRPRPVDRQARRRHPRWRRAGVVGRGPGLDVHPDPAARPNGTRRTRL